MKNFNLQLITNTFIKIGVIAALIIGVFTKQEYSYYMFLRWLIATSFVYFGVYSYSKQQFGILIFYIAIAILFNPFKIFTFQKETWHLIDLIIAGIVLITIFIDVIFYKKITNLN